MREFSSGATRDTVEGKLSYMKALSPAVLRRYLQYLSKHRVQADGKLRAFDNWKKGIDGAVYLDSLLRHTMDAWLVTEGVEPTEDGAVLEDLLCAIMFNTMGYLHEVLKARLEEKDIGFICGDCKEFYENSGTCSMNYNEDRKRLSTDIADDACFEPMEKKK